MGLLSHSRVAARLVTDVVVYRLKKREMFNFFAALSIMVALRGRPQDIVVRLLFAFALNILVYLINDYFDVELDLQTETRDRGKVVFLKEHKSQARVLMVAGFLALAVWASIYDPGLLAPLTGGAGICWLYSARLKRVPIADVISMTFWGGFMPMVGIFLDSRNGWLLIGQLALFSSCFETIQTLRDRESDRLAGMATTAVYLGERGTTILLRALFLVNALYAILLLHRIFGLFFLVAAALPVVTGKMDAYWNRVRLIFGLSWLAILVQFYLYDFPLGLIYAKLPFP